MQAGSPRPNSLDGCIDADIAYLRVIFAFVKPRLIAFQF